MTQTAKRSKLVSLALTTALATTALGGCTTNAGPPSFESASKAERALAKGETSKAIQHAEAAVQGDPRNASFRAMLGAAYLEAGRFQSAATSFDDALSLGDTSARTALSFALAKSAMGDYAKAGAVLDDWQDDIAAADLGLALALSGDADRGVQILGNALRAGENTPKVRQNLAYAYALQGNWRAARLMAAEDVPADQLDARISQWAQTAKPEDYQQRIAGLLNAPIVADSGQPMQLALVNTPSDEQFAVEAAAHSEPQLAALDADNAYAFAQPAGELPPVGDVGFVADTAVPIREVEAPAPTIIDTPVQLVAKPETFEDAFEAPAPTGASPAAVAMDTMRFANSPAVQTAPARLGAAPATSESRVAAAKTAPTASGDHLVQLGSFSSERGAKRAWGIYAKRYPQLSQHDMVITKAVVRGKTYYRVSAAGFGKASARSMCSTVKGQGHGCFAWAEGRPMPGAVDTGVRMARR